MPFDDRNVLGGKLNPCSTSPRTGFYRDGCCNTGPEDLGLHVVCVQVTAEFLAFARSRGNDLVTLGCNRAACLPQHALAHRHDFLRDKHEVPTVHLDTRIEAIRKRRGCRGL